MAVTVYPVIGEPFELGAVQETLAEPTPEVAVGTAGVAGDVAMSSGGLLARYASAVDALDTAAHIPLPYAAELHVVTEGNVCVVHVTPFVDEID